MRCTGASFIHGAADLGQFVHQRGLRMHASRGIHQHNIAPRFKGRINRIISDARRIVPHFTADKIASDLFTPEFQLGGAGRAEGIGSAKHRFESLPHGHPGQFGRGCGLTGTVYPKQQYNMRFVKRGPFKRRGIT